MKVLRADIPQQPMGIVAVANDTNSCEYLSLPPFSLHWINLNSIKLEHNISVTRDHHVVVFYPILCFYDQISANQMTFSSAWLCCLLPMLLDLLLWLLYNKN